MPLSTEEKILIETRLTNDGPSMLVAYMLFGGLGFFGAHRIYLGRWKSAILQFVTMFIVVGWVWLIVDMFLIPKMIRQKRDEQREVLTNQALGLLPVAA